MKRIHYLVLFLIICLAPLSYAAENQPFELYGLSLCKNPQYQCIPVKQGATWETLFPDIKLRDIVMRLNRTNVPLFYRSWLLIPKNLTDINYLNLSPLPRHMNSSNHPLLFVNLSVFAFGAYNAAGDLIYWGPAAGGQTWCTELGRSCASATGTFRIFRTAGADCTSSEFPMESHGGASMPYCMFYYKGFAIHGSTLDGFVDRSKGCVRLFYDDAKWLHLNFAKVGTQVIVQY